MAPRSTPWHRRRRHGLFVNVAPRRALERAGWRTTLDYRENHVRSLDGSLLSVDQLWFGEAERDGMCIGATGSSEQAVFDALAVRARDMQHVTGQRAVG